MPMYHAEPNRAAPNYWAWYSVETPGVFKEIQLPAAEENFSPAHRRQYNRLHRLAEELGTHVHYSLYRRG